MRVRILYDYVGVSDPVTPVKPGTIVEATIDPEYDDAWYTHPETGDEWFSFSGDYEVLDD